MDSRLALGIRALAREKRSNDPLTAAVDQAARTQLRSDAVNDVRNLALMTLGVGAAGRGVVGLMNMLRRHKPSPRLQGPTELPLPLPYQAEEDQPQLKVASITTKTALPGYGPAMMLTGMAGLGLGWKGADMVLDTMRKKEREQELAAARKEFHDALLHQYDAPLSTGSSTAALQKTAAAAIGGELDQLFDRVVDGIEKTATMADWGGHAANTYGTYAGLAALLAGAWAYDKANKRSRRSVLESALKKRQRKQFDQSPTEIFAVPEPATTVPGM